MLAFGTLKLEAQKSFKKMTWPMHIKHRRDSDAPLKVSTTDFIFKLAALDADIWGGVNALLGYWVNLFQHPIQPVLANKVNYPQCKKSNLK